MIRFPCEQALLAKKTDIKVEIRILQKLNSEIIAIQFMVRKSCEIEVKNVMKVNVQLVN